MKFNEFNLPTGLLETLHKQGFEEATEIQASSYPILREGKDLVGLSQTGSGKTFAYGIPAILGIEPELRAVQVLIVCPTRELVVQVYDEMKKISQTSHGIQIAAIFGGSNMDRQITSIKRGANIIVGTPGRLMDHLQRKTLKLKQLKMLVLDEADEMLNMGFKEDIETILSSTNDTHQTVMFSATMPPAIMTITKQFMQDPVVIKTAAQEEAQSFIKQYYCACEKEEKTKAMVALLNDFRPTTAIIFCNTKRMVDQLSGELERRGYDAIGLHGDMRQNERKRIMAKVKNEGSGILVATDVAARGIDIKDVDVVFNYDFPSNKEYYIHRIGRTARAGKAGVAITLLNLRKQVREMRELALATKNDIQKYDVPGMEALDIEEDSVLKRRAGQKKTTSEQGFSTSRRRERSGNPDGERRTRRDPSSASLKSRSTSSEGGWKKKTETSSSESKEPRRTGYGRKTREDNRDARGSFDRKPYDRERNSMRRTPRSNDSSRSASDYESSSAETQEITFSNQHFGRQRKDGERRETTSGRRRVEDGRSRENRFSSTRGTSVENRRKPREGSSYSHNRKESGVDRRERNTDDSKPFRERGERKSSYATSNRSSSKPAEKRWQRDRYQEVDPRKERKEKERKINQSYDQLKAMAQQQRVPHRSTNRGK